MDVRAPFGSQSKGAMRICHSLASSFALYALSLACFIATVPAKADIPVAASPDYEQRPAVAHNSTAGGFMVAYLRNADPTQPDRFELRVRPIGADGSPTGSEVAPLIGSPSVVGRPDIAYSPVLGRYFVAVTERLDDRDRVLGRALNPDGTPASAQLTLFDEPGKRLYESGGAGVSALRVVHNETLNEFVVTIQRRYVDPNNANANLHEVVAQRITKAAITGPVVTLYGPSQSGFGSHALAYAPSAGHYLFGVEPWGPSGQFKLLDGNLGLVTDVPFHSGEPDGHSAQFDIASGNIEGKDLFLVVWSDDNNCKPGIVPCPNLSDQQSGIWGSYIDPATTSYGPSGNNVSFPISYIWKHVADRRAYMPRVAYSPGLKGFFVVWRELPVNDPYNDESRSHIRGARVVDLQHKSGPGSNFVLSQITGTCPTGGGACPSLQDPTYPDVAAGSVSALVVWEQYGSSTPANRDVWADLTIVPVVELAPVNPSDDSSKQVPGPLATRISVTNPNSESYWYKFKPYTITWLASDIDSPKVTLSLLKGGNDIVTIVPQTDTTVAGKSYGIFPWTVPGSLPDGSTMPDGQYQVRVQTTDKKFSGVSQPFQIATLYEVLDISELLSEKCELEAKIAVLAQNTNTSNNCGFNGPVWHNDYQKHFNWCMEHAFLNYPAVKSRRKQMWDELYGCLGSYEVTAKLTKLDVHDDCDNVSDGDWYVSLSSRGNPSFNLPGDTAVWPGTTDASNVDTGSSYSPNIDNRITIRGNASLHLAIGVIDCDGSPGTWFWPLVGVPIPPIGTLFASFEQSMPGVDCDGEEEVLEFSGGNDWLGYTSLEVPPSAWKSGTTVTIVAGKEAMQACESDGPPYTAHISIQAKIKPPFQP